MPMITRKDMERQARVLSEAMGRMARAEARLAKLADDTLDENARAAEIAVDFLAANDYPGAAAVLGAFPEVLS